MWDRSNLIIDEIYERNKHDMGNINLRDKIKLLRAFKSLKSEIDKSLGENYQNICKIAAIDEKDLILQEADTDLSLFRRF